MQAKSKIDHLIAELTNLKTILSDDSPSNEKRFNDLLKASIATNQTVADEEMEGTFSSNAKPEDIKQPGHGWEQGDISVYIVNIQKRIARQTNVTDHYSLT